MQGANKYTHVIWDWNGTLFNDVEWCVKVINKMLGSRDFRLLSSVAEYHGVFCFPVIEYYKKIGFDFETEPFECLAEEYMALYHVGKTGGCRLDENAEFVLAEIQKKGIEQSILSASETSNLLSQIGEFDIVCYFDAILGLSDIYAKSKLDIGLDYIVKKRIKNVLLIGDTEHDYEVARALGADCLLVAAGHQSKERLMACGAPVLDSLLQIVEYV